TAQGLESHLALMHKYVLDHQPHAVVVDPIGNLAGISSGEEARVMMVRLIDLLKTRGITAVLTSLTSGAALSEEATETAGSSIVDPWLLVKSVEAAGERNRGLYVLKSRGMAHSNQIREFLIASQGVNLVDVYVGPGGVLTGAARQQQEIRERAELLARGQDI